MNPLETPAAVGTKPLRADAQRNRDRLVAAGREVFAEKGFDVSLDEIARHAGVGVGTAYRRFANKEALIDEIFEERVREMTGVLQSALDREDPWEGLQDFIVDMLRMQSEDRGLKQAFHQADETRARIEEAKSVMQPMITELIERAQATGKLRADITPTDVMMGIMMLGTVIDATRDIRPDAWRRYLALAIDGLATGQGATGALPGEPLTVEEFDEALNCLQG
jgi:AcrR family transcriptional regulator